MNIWSLTSDVFLGDLWRLWTAHLVHYDAVHLLLNAVAALPALLMLSKADRERAMLWAVVAAPAISVVILASGFGTEYRGASALVVGLWFFAPLRAPSRYGAAMLLLATVKVIVEMTTPLQLGVVDVAPLPIAHLAGAAAGVAGGVRSGFMRQRFFVDAHR